MADTKPEKDTDLTFLEEKKGNFFQFKDVIFLILHNLHWLLIFALAGAAIAFVYVKKQDRLYESSARIIIKSSTANSGTSLREAVGRSIIDRQLYNSPINNEIMLLSSKTTMTQVVKNLDINTSYIAQTKLMKREKDLYSDSPIRVHFIDNGEGRYLSITVTPLDKKFIRIQNHGYKPFIARFNDTIPTPDGRIVVEPTWYMTEDYIKIPIKVTNSPAADIAEIYRSRMSVAQQDENTMVTLSIRDKSAQRAADILNEVITVYNDNAINDKKAIIANTYEYINERMNHLDDELGAKESQIASFKRDNQL